jgi:serine phosphatase RsbU (regulator of sigma subunit)/anti-sigma regulatory factor (Ser/Thr protein kinase)
MAALLKTMQRLRMGRRKPAPTSSQQRALELAKQMTSKLAVEVAPSDPIIAHFARAPGAVELDTLHLESPAVTELRAAGVKLVIPLVNQGELVGLLNLGARLSQQDYSFEDRKLLDTLANQAAPALRVAQLVREQEALARAHERVEHELRVARLIQQTLLPRALPAIDGWQLATHYQPARAVGGDFYDFLQFEDGRLGMVIGDVTDKGVPAALVMATTRSILRFAANNERSPGVVLERTNELLRHDMPPKMFVTCLYAVLDPASGRLRYANAGHDLPYQRHGASVYELRATGMPLGLMPGMRYEERETVLDSGDSVLLYSDGLVEAHNPEREMFGFPRLADLVKSYTDDADDTPLISVLLQHLAAFTGDGWEQEDDVTLVSLRRVGGDGHRMSTNASTTPSGELDDEFSNEQGWRTLDAWSIASETGNERGVIKRVAEVVRALGLPAQRLEDLKTAVAEATTNAIEHGNHYQADLPVTIQVLASQSRLAVRITDEGGNFSLSQTTAPDLDAKLAGLQSPRGWGLFLIERLVDTVRVTGDERSHTIELLMRLPS